MVAFYTEEELKNLFRKSDRFFFVSAMINVGCFENERAKQRGVIVYGRLQEFLLFGMVQRTD